jgi:hypothetical protein
MTTQEFIQDKVRERDRFELDLSDAFDVKASIVLLILTFLGTISATLLTAEKLSTLAKIWQIPVALLLVISGIYCIACLWPKNYLLDDLPKVYMDWAASLGQSDPQQCESVTERNLTLANDRIQHNHLLNTTKTYYLNRAFHFMTAALIVELAALLYIIFANRPS